MRRIIVNADDFGISEGTNRAIQQAHRDGILTSASLMVNMPGFGHAVETVIADSPGLDVGLHLCLTSGPAVLDRCRIPLLVDEAGRFRRSIFGLCQLLLGRHRRAAMRQIALELEAQFSKAKAAGIDYSHVDGHQHVQMIPKIFNVVTPWLSQRPNAFLRVSREPNRPVAGRRSAVPSGLSLVPTARRLILARLAETCLGRANPVRHVDAVYGITASGRVDREILKDIAATAPVGVSEVIIHPSLCGSRVECECLSHADQKFLKSPRREAEFRTLVDSVMAKEITSRGAVLSTFREVALADATAQGASQSPVSPWN